MQAPQLRQEFNVRHLRSTAIELSNPHHTGWTERKDAAADLLDLTYPTADVRRALDVVSATAAGKPIVLLGPRGTGKSHILALVHHAFRAPDAVEAWAHSWGQALQSEQLTGLKLQRGFLAVSETLSNQVHSFLWELLFDRHPKGPYYRGKFEESGMLVPAKSLLQDMFLEQKTALMLDELHTWHAGLHDEPGPVGKTRRQEASEFMQMLAELAEDRPDLFSLLVSVRDSTSDSLQQIHRTGPVVIDFAGDTARADRKKLVLHRLFPDREYLPREEVAKAIQVYASERTRLLHPDSTPDHEARLQQEAVECWPFAPELLDLVEDHIHMPAAAPGGDESRDFIRMLAEVFRVRGEQVPVVTPADFFVDDDDCGVPTLIDAFSTSADQFALRDKAIRNLRALREAGVEAPRAREIITSIWVRSLGSTEAAGGTRRHVQLDITRTKPVDDDAFTAELTTIVENTLNIHEVGTTDSRLCFRLHENPDSKLKMLARNDQAFEASHPQRLLPVRRDQDYLKQVLHDVLKTPEGTTAPPSQLVILDPNWDRAPWTALSMSDQPGWTERDRPVLIVLPVAPAPVSDVLGPWLATHVPQNRKMVRFLLPKAGADNLYDDRTLLTTARCALLASEWKKTDPQYDTLHRKFEAALKTELEGRFDRYALLTSWDLQTPERSTFHEDSHGAIGADIPAAVEAHVASHHFASDVREPLDHRPGPRVSC